MNISVGELASTISCIALVLSIIFIRICENIAVLNLKSRLMGEEGKAPLVTGSDFWLPHSIRSLIKFRLYPGIFLAILFCTALVLADLSLEIGVSQTSNCDPEKTTGYLIESQLGLNNTPTDVELAPLCANLQDRKFVRGQDFRYVATGFPREVNDNLCISCLPKPREDNIIASDCNISERRMVTHGYIGIQRTRFAFGTVAVGVRIITEDGRNDTFRGQGDLTKNLRNENSIILFTSKQPNINQPDLNRKISSSNQPMLYWEFNNQTQINGLFDRALNEEENNNFTGEVWEKMCGPIFRYEISCVRNEVPLAEFQRALLVYRSIHLERLFRPAKLDAKRGTFDELKSSDFYRAIIALKAAEDVVKSAEEKPYSVYPECATYDPKFATATIICLISICILWGVSVLLKNRQSKEQFEKISAALNKLNESESIIPGSVVQFNPAVTADGSAEISLDNCNGCMEYELSEPSRKNRWLKEADLVRVVRDDMDNIIGLRIIPHDENLIVAIQNDKNKSSF